MKMFSKFIFIISILAQTIQAKFYTTNEYLLPKTDAQRSTIAGSFFNAPKQRSEKISIKSSKGEALRFRYYPSTKKSESIVIILAGIGGNSDGNLSKMIASAVARKGKHSLIVPSVFTKEFANSFSKSGYAGFIPQDSVDLLNGIKLGLQAISNKTNQQFKKFSLVGYSLGALTAAHMSKISSESSKIIKFERVLIINTPVDLIYGLRYLDNSASYRTEIGKFRLIKIIARWVASVEVIANRTGTSKRFKRITKIMGKLKEKELKALVAISLMGSLKDVIKASQKSHDLKLIRKKFRKGSEKENKLSDIKFEGYVRDFLFRYYTQLKNKDWQTVQDLNREASIYAVADHIRNSNNIFLMHNQDDFLLRGEEDIDYLLSLFGPERSFIYPHGGHLGNLWFKKNREDYLSILF